MRHNRYNLHQTPSFSNTRQTFKADVVTSMNNILPKRIGTADPHKQNNTADMRVRSIAVLFQQVTLVLNHSFGKSRHLNRDDSFLRSLCKNKGIKAISFCNFTF